MNVVAGEDLDAGEFVYIAVNGKAYRCAAKPKPWIEWDASLQSWVINPPNCRCTMLPMNSQAPHPADDMPEPTIIMKERP